MCLGIVEPAAGTSLEGDFAKIAQQGTSTLSGLDDKIDESHWPRRADPEMEYTVLFAAEGGETVLARGASKSNRRSAPTVGIVLGEPHDGSLAAILNGIEIESVYAGYQPCAVSRHESERFSTADSRSHSCRQYDSIEWPSLPGRENWPAIVVSHRSKTTWATSIEVDHEFGAELALKHLAGLGHRRIAFIGGENDRLNASSRRSSFFYAAKSLGLEIHGKTCTLSTDRNRRAESIDSILRALVDQGTGITAICCSDTTIAVAALQAANDAGLSCPEDLSVISLDGIDDELSLDACLTTIRQPVERMGSLAARVLLEQVRYPQAQFCRSMLVQPGLVVRASTGPARSDRDPLRKVWFGPSLANC